MSGPRWRAPAAFALCVAIWGGSWIAIEAAVAGADPFGIAALRTTLAFLVLLALAALARVPRPTMAGAARAMGVGLVFVGINFALVYWSAPQLPAGLSPILYATAPLQAAALSPLFGLRDRWSPRALAGAAVGLGGMLLAFWGVRGVAAVPTLAAAAVVLAATTSAAGTIMARRWSALHPLWMNAFANLSASGLLWAWYALDPSGSPVPQGEAAWAGFAYMLLGGSVVGFLAYFLLVREWDATRATFTTLATPFAGLLAAALLVGESITAAQVAGAILVVLGGWLALAGARREPAPGPGLQPAG